MKINLIDRVEDYLTPDIIHKAASYVGESDTATQNALGSIVPTLVGALADQASTTNGAQQLVRMLDSDEHDGGALDSLASRFSGGATTRNAVGAGKGIVDSLFGGKAADVTDLIARSSGVRTGSASSLLALAAPLVLQVLDKLRGSLGQGSSALTALLGEQKSFLGGLLPAGLASLLGWRGFAPGSGDIPVAPRAPGEAYREPAWAPAGAASSPTRRSNLSWILPVLILGGLALSLLAWLSNRESAPPSTAQSTPAPAPAAATPATTVGQAIKMALLRLPDGQTISIPDGSPTYSLYQWLARSTDLKVPNRFVLDRMNFESGTTRLTPESIATVQSLAAILNAYPTVAIRLEGHTDSTGNADDNKTLSLERASAVKDIMLKAGVAGSRIATAGLGDEQPVAANDSEEGRAKNRRLELVVTQR